MSRLKSYVVDLQIISFKHGNRALQKFENDTRYTYTRFGFKIRFTIAADVICKCFYYREIIGNKIDKYEVYSVTNQ